MPRIVAQAVVTTSAILALTAVLAGPAFARWFAEGSELTGGLREALSTTAKADSFVKLNLPGAKIKLECTSSVLSGEEPEINGTGPFRATKLVFEGCKTIEPTSGCELSASTISTQPLEAVAIEGPSSPDARLLFSARTKTLLAEIPFKAPTTCALEGNQPVKGKFTVNAPTLQEELVNQPIESMGSVENNSLEVSGNKAFLEGGKVLLRLASGKKFKVAPDLVVEVVGGAPIFNFATGELELKFAVNEKAEFKVWNASKAEFPLEKKEIAPNENNYKFVAPVNAPECKPPQKLKPGIGNACYLAIKFQNKVEGAKFKLEFNGGKLYALPLT